MFQSVSGYSSEQSIAHYSSQPTVSQLQGVSDKNSNRMASSVVRNRKVSERINFFNFCNIQDNVQAFQLTGLL